jgi:hypothetical protein
MDIVSGTTARAPRNLLKGSRVELLQRVASVGFASVLLASAIFAIGAAVITKQTLQDVSTANVLNALYQEARYEVGAEESLERKYRLEPSPEVRADHRAAERSLENAIRAVAAAGDAEDRLISVKVLKAHAGYVSATKLMFAAVDRNQPALALSLDHNKIDPVFGVVEASVFGEAADQRSETNVIVEHLKEIQSRVIALTVALSLLNLLFFIAYFWLLMTYRRRLGETHDVEIKALEEASLIDHLTNIGNHRAYQEDLRRYESRQRSERTHAWRHRSRSPRIAAAKYSGRRSPVSLRRRRVWFASVQHVRARSGAAHGATPAASQRESFGSHNQHRNRLTQRLRL